MNYDLLLPLPLLLIIVTLVCGCAGGYGGYLIERVKLVRSRRAASATEDALYMKLSLVLGVVAAFSIPAFLELASIGQGSTTLIDGILIPGKAGIQSKSLLVYSGFCLIAAVSGQSFITTLSSTMLEQLDAQIEAAQKDANEAMQRSDEAEEEIEELMQDMEVLHQSRGVPSLQPHTMVVLQEINKSLNRRVELDEVSSTTGFNKSQIRSSLQELEALNMLSGKDSEGVTTWRTRSAGRAALKARLDEK